MLNTILLAIMALLSILALSSTFQPSKMFHRIVHPKIVQIGKDMKNQTDHLEGRANSLSRDHSDLKEGVKEAQNAIQNAMRSDMAQLTGMTSFLRDAQIREDAQQPHDPIAEAARRMAEEAAAQAPEPEDGLER